ERPTGGRCSSPTGTSASAATRWSWRACSSIFAPPTPRPRLRELRPARVRPCPAPRARRLAPAPRAPAARAGLAPRREPLLLRLRPALGAADHPRLLPGRLADGAVAR